MLRLWQRDTWLFHRFPLSMEIPTPGLRCFEATGGEMVTSGHMEMLETKAWREKPFISLFK